MAGRVERCGGCGTQLRVPAGSQTIRCAVCWTVTTLRPDHHYHFNHNHNFNTSIIQAGQDSVYCATAMLRSAVSSVVSGGGLYGRPRPMNIPPAVGPVTAAPLPVAYGRRRAVVCGVTYIGKSYGIKGSVNDVAFVKYFLLHNMGFPLSSILVLTEYEADPGRVPTKRNMVRALRWLVEGVQSGDSLVFYFSGHGSRQRDTNNDELDGYDETLCPVDYETAGKILDDDINDLIVRPLPRGAMLHAIVDACHSGTVLDLPFVCRMNREGCYMWEDQRRGSIYKGTSGGLAISISACDDNQTSADTNALSGGHTLTGAMTYSLIQAVQNEPGLTYGRLLAAMRNTIREAKTGIRLGGPIVSLLNKILRTELSQEPQLSSSQQFNIYSNRFVL